MGSKLSLEDVSKEPSRLSICDVCEENRIYRGHFLICRYDRSLRKWKVESARVQSVCHTCQRIAFLSGLKIFRWVNHNRPTYSEMIEEDDYPWLTKTQLQKYVEWPVTNIK